MTWEAITALATLGTGLAIIATVLLGIRQLQLTRSQLAHLRRATQLEGVMKIFDDLNSQEFWDSLHFIATELPKRMTEPQFRDEVALVGMADTNVHRELPLMRTFERIGTYVKHGLIDGPVIYDFALPPIERSWELLSDVVRIHRTANDDPAFWENFEMLYREGKRWTQHNSKITVVASQEA
jgi:hypothetical protein